MRRGVQRAAGASGLTPPGGGPRGGARGPPPRGAARPRATASGGGPPPARGGPPRGGVPAPPGPSSWGAAPRLERGLPLPGRANRSNAAMAVAAASHLGVEPAAALAAIASLTAVDARYRSTEVDGVPVRLLLA